jgi:predicted O-linked N-acetylglucosamine transferase (SPINDLY family)
MLYQLYAVVDVMLDPFPYGSGVATNLDAFAVGIPVVTLPSASSNMACTAGLYKHMVSIYLCIPIEQAQ